MPKTKTVREIPIIEIEDEFRLSSYWFGSTWCPAVDRRENGGYQIRVLAGETTRGLDTTTSYDYFYLDPEGIILATPRGYAKDFKPGRIPVAELEATVAKYAQAVR